MPIHDNFYYLLTNTPTNYPITITETEALDYLNYINKSNFLYNNISNYNIIDYEKLIFIEYTFINNQEIQELLIEIKKNIADGYYIKNQYKNRIFDFKNIILNPIDIDYSNGYYGLPKKNERGTYDI